MRVILSTEKIQDIQEKLMKCKNVPEVHDLIMDLPYFCFLHIEKKQNLELLKNELILFFSAFRTSLNIYIMHNEYFYEYDGINRLNFFDYFRNIVERNAPTKISISEKVENLVSEILLKTQKNNFNENEIIVLEQQRLSTNC